MASLSSLKCDFSFLRMTYRRTLQVVTKDLGFEMGGGVRHEHGDMSPAGRV